MSHEYGAIAVLAQKIQQIITVHNAPEIWSIPLKILCAKNLLFSVHTQHMQCVHKIVM